MEIPGFVQISIDYTALIRFSINSRCPQIADRAARRELCKSEFLRTQLVKIGIQGGVGNKTCVSYRSFSPDRDLLERSGVSVRVIKDGALELVNYCIKETR